MSETPQEYYARVLGRADAERRLPVPEQAFWEIFPFEPTSLRAKPLDELLLPEPARAGEDGRDCPRCQRDSADAVWSNDRWLLSPTPEPLGLPFAAILESRAHVDLGDLDDECAAELGRIVVRVSRAVEALETVARVHVNRWGDGGAHLHVWFLGRPAGLVQLRGSCLPLWDDMLPRQPADLAEQTLRVAADALLELGGETTV